MAYPSACIIGRSRSHSISSARRARRARPESVLLLELLDAPYCARGGVIAEHGHRRVAEARDEAQHLERLRAAVDEIADEPELVAAAAKADLAEQLFSSS
jgi:hypothetical protein